MPKDTLVFNIETITDAKASRHLLNQPDLDDATARHKPSDYFNQKDTAHALSSPFQQVVAISYAHLVNEPGENNEPEIMLRRIASGGDEHSSEADLLEAFFKLIETRKPRLVSFNGRSFNLPVLKYRAMIHGLSCPHWFSTGDHWNHYDSRYSNVYHIDLPEVLSDYGASRPCSLHEIASSFGIPNKQLHSDDDIHSLFEQHDLHSIRDHCELDVCSILLIFLRWQLFYGTLNQNSYARTLLGIHHYLESEAEHHPHFATFLSLWDKLQA